MCVINLGCLKCCQQSLCEALFSFIIAFFEPFPFALSSHTKKCEEVKITQGINQRLSVFSLKEHILCSTTNRPLHYSMVARLIKENKQELQAHLLCIYLESFFCTALTHQTLRWLFVLFGVTHTAFFKLLSFSLTWLFPFSWEATRVQLVHKKAS